MEGIDPMDVDEDPMQNAEESAEDGCGVNNRPFAENVLHRTIKLGKEANPESVLEPIGAILNSGGGIVEMKIAGFSAFTSELFKELDLFWQTLEKKLNPIIQPSTYADVFDRKIEDDKIFLFIKAPDHFCTVDYNLFVPGDAEVLPATYHKVQELLSKKPLKKKSKPQFPLPVNLLPETFKFNEVLNFHESKNIQLKYYPSKNKLLYNNNRKQVEKIKKQISAFGNGNGGLILLGVNDTGEVHGQSMEGDSKAELEERVEFIVNEMSKTWPFTPRRGVHWDLQFFPVVGRESNPVIVIYIAGMQNLGGIFMKCPKSFELQRPSGSDGEEKIVRLDFHTWKQRMLRGTHLDESKGMKEAMAKLTTLSILKGPLLTVRGSVQKIRRKFFKVGPGCPVSPEGFERNLPETAKYVIQQIQEQCSGIRNRSLLVASRSWRSCVTKADNCSREDGVICDLLLFDKEKGGVHLFTLCNSESDVQFLPYAQITARAIKEALVVNGGCHEKFYITCHVVPCRTAVHVGPLSHDSRYPIEYKLESSREKVNQILKSLVIVLAQVPSTLSNKQGISFFNLLTVEQFQLLYQEIDRHRELWIKGAAGTGKTLVAVEFIRELNRRDASLKPDNILYVCENIGIIREIRKLGICQCVSRQSFMEHLFPDVKHVILDEVQNYREQEGNWLRKARMVVRQHNDYEHDSSLDLDTEADSDPESYGNSSQADSISDSESVPCFNPNSMSSTQSGTEQDQVSDPESNSDSDSDSDTEVEPYPKLSNTGHLKKNLGFLWLFTDSNQVNHRFKTGIPNEIGQNPSFHLTKVIRNSKEIFNFAKYFLSDDAAYHITIGHDFEGEEVSFVKYSEGKQVVKLIEVLKSLLTEGYDKGDIAILFEKEACIPKGIGWSVCMDVGFVVDAGSNDSENIVLSTFRKYSGLERPVVILVNIGATLSQYSRRNASFYCAITRAMVKLVFLDEKKSKGQKRKKKA